MCDLEYGYMGFTRTIRKIVGQTYQNLSGVSTAESSENKFYKYEKIPGIKPSTAYTWIFDIKSENTLTTGNNTEIVRIDLTLENGEQTIPCGFSGTVTNVFQRVKLKFNTPSANIKFIEFNLRNQFNVIDSSLTSNTITLKNNMLLEGDYTNTDLPTSINEIESACENENNVLLLKGKYNETHGITLLNGDKNTIENGVYIQNIGKIVLDGTQPLLYNGLSNDTYICAVYSDNSFDSVIYSSIYVEGEYKAISHNIMVPDSNTCGFNIRMGNNKGIFMRFPISEVGDNIEQLNNYLKTNNHIVYYKLAQPIYNPPNITNINLPQPLRSLPNGVCDELVGNKLIQRVGKYTITGTEIYDLRFKNDYMFVVQFNDILTEPAFGDYNNSNTKMICDKALCRDCSNTTFVSNSLTIGGRATNSKGFIVAIPTRLLTEYTVPNAKQYIQSLGGMAVYYELATPVETTINVNIKKIKKSKCYNKIKPTII